MNNDLKDKLLAYSKTREMFYSNLSDETLKRKYFEFVKDSFLNPPNFMPATQEEAESLLKDSLNSASLLEEIIKRDCDIIQWDCDARKKLGMQPLEEEQLKYLQNIIDDRKNNREFSPDFF